VISRTKVICSVIGLLYLLFWLGFAGNHAVQGSDFSYSGNIQGVIRDRSTKSPIEDAVIRIQELELDAFTNQKGEFYLTNVALPRAYFPVTIIVTAPGYASWSTRNILLVANDILFLTPTLGNYPIFKIMPLRDNMIKDGIQPELSAPLQLPFESIPQSDNVFPGFTGVYDVPHNIRVRVTGHPNCNLNRDYVVETLDFKQYVKHVLPNEWIPGWPAESLRAGALATKMYAWYWIDRGGKWDDADVYDSTCDQVYNPDVAYQSTNQAVDYTWYWLLTREGVLIENHHMTDCNPPDCMSQIGTEDLARSGYTWDEIVFYYYTDSFLQSLYQPTAGFVLIFNGSPGDDNENRVLIPVDDPSTTSPGPPVDIGGQDFTIEWWLKANGTEDSAPAITCGSNQNWVYGNILLDRTRSTARRGYGVSLGGGRLAFGVVNESQVSATLCGNHVLNDNHWHHVAVQRQLSDGRMWIYIDGQLENSVSGPTGDISYPDDASPVSASDPFLAIGAWKLDDDPLQHPFYRGWIDELRFSNIIRYTTSFTPTNMTFSPDANTVALYHLDEGIGQIVKDTSGVAGGPSNGERLFGGDINGPEWWYSDLFLVLTFTYFPLIQ
jgi:hypothetical protein